MRAKQTSIIIIFFFRLLTHVPCARKHVGSIIAQHVKKKKTIKVNNNYYSGASGETASRCRKVHRPVLYPVAAAAAVVRV